jgi:hypothetical protein
MKKKLRFYECEHEGDLDAYADAVTASGGVILESRLSASSESGIIVAEFTEPAWEKFKGTDAYGFLD